MSVESAVREKESVATKNDTWLRGRDIWIRARTNAFAHDQASRSLRKTADWIFILQTSFVVIPIILISLSLQVMSTNFQAIVFQQQEQLSFPFTLDNKLLSVVAIVFNGLALLLSLLSNRFRWAERALKHDELLSMYQLIAQKARRLEDPWMELKEARLYCGNLQDLFETAKKPRIRA